MIGRNEGTRLREGLRAIQRECPGAVITYVDSGSEDDSAEIARSLGVIVVELDLAIPFTAARARNAGFRRLLEMVPELQLVQFLDGDCELAPEWIAYGSRWLEEHASVAIVSGRRREKNPDDSIYNALIDIEWDTPVGEANMVLGDMMVRVAAFQEVSGFSEDIISAEDDDLCLRIRAAGHHIWRLDAPMSFHEANLTSLAQWFRRAKRCGHGYANIYHLHRSGLQGPFIRELLLAAFWGGALPLILLLTIVLHPLWSIWIPGVWLASLSRTVLRRLRRGDSFRVALCYGILIYSSKGFEFSGALHYWKNHLLSRSHRLIEYK